MNMVNTRLGRPQAEGMVVVVSGGAGGPLTVEDDDRQRRGVTSDAVEEATVAADPEAPPTTEELAGMKRPAPLGRSAARWAGGWGGVARGARSDSDRYAAGKEHARSPISRHELISGRLREIRRACGGRSRLG